MVADVAQHAGDQRVPAHRGGQCLGHRADLGPPCQRLGAQRVDLLLGGLDAAAKFVVLGAEAVDLGGSHCAKIERG